MTGDPLLPDDTNAALDPISAALSAPPVGAGMPTPAGGTAPAVGLGALNSYIADRYSPANKQALKDKMDASQGALASLLTNPEVDERSKWFQFASAVGRPTKSGRFAEAASNGLDALTNAESSQFQLQQRYKLALAQMTQQRDQQQYDSFDKSQQAAMLAMTKSATSKAMNPPPKMDALGRMHYVDPNTGEDHIAVGDDAVAFQRNLAAGLKLAADAQLTDTDQAMDFATKYATRMTQVGKSTGPEALDVAGQLQQLDLVKKAALARGDYAAATSAATRAAQIAASARAGGPSAPSPVAPTALPDTPLAPGEVPGKVSPAPAGSWEANLKAALADPDPAVQADARAKLAQAKTPLGDPNVTGVPKPTNAPLRQPDTQAFDTATGKESAEYYNKDLLPAASNAKSTLLNNNILLTAFDKGLIKPGKLNEFQGQLGAWASALGIPSSTVDTAVQNQTFGPLIQEARNKILMAAKGTQTEGDAQRALTQLANLGQTPEAFRRTLLLENAVAQRKVDEAGFFDSYAAKPENQGRTIGAQAAYLKSKQATLPLVGFSSKGDVVTFKDYAAKFKAQYPQATDNDLHDAWMQAAGGAK